MVDSGAIPDSYDVSNVDGNNIEILVVRRVRRGRRTGRAWWRRWVCFELSAFTVLRKNCFGS
ncbi:hypothetical protein HAX54_028919, partial [Datura stramonium]|nr:hypothetical protein [Datura stramonium]